MKARLSSIIALTAVVFSICGSSVMLSTAAPLQQTILTTTTAPQLTMFSSWLGLNATYKNNVNTQIVAITIVVAHNFLGQTVAIFTGTFFIQPNDSSTTYVIFYPPLPSKQAYSVLVYVVSAEGLVISNSYTLSVFT